MQRVDGLRHGDVAAKGREQPIVGRVEPQTFGFLVCGVREGIDTQILFLIGSELLGVPEKTSEARRYPL